MAHWQLRVPASTGCRVTFGKAGRLTFGWTGGEMLRLSFWSHGFLARTEYSSHMDRGQLAFYSPLCPSPERRQEPAGDTTLPSLAPQGSPSHLCLTRLPSLGLERKRQRRAGEPGQCLRRSAASLGAHLPPGAGSASALAKGSCGCVPCTGCTLVSLKRSPCQGVVFWVPDSGAEFHCVCVRTLGR